MAVAEQLARLFSFGIAVDGQYSQYKGAWAEETAYVIGDIVLNTSTYYHCIQAHTSDTAVEDVDEPGTGSSWQDYWESLGDSGFADIDGITSFSPSPEKNDTDTTKFSSNGWLEHIVASRSLTFTVEGMHREDSSSGVRDPGQTILEDLAEQVGPSSTDTFQITVPSGTFITFEVSIDAPFKGMSAGGGNDDTAGWTCNLSMTGEASTS